jgi:endonuclease/exonuclease/phosphatase family metal-dependent hydrolase
LIVRDGMRSAVLLICAALSSAALADTELTVMTFNIWGGGANQGKPIDETVAVIRAVNPDIIGLQETRVESDPCEAESCRPAGESVARQLAAALGYYHYDQTAGNEALWANAVISRHPFVGKATPNDTGIAIDVAGRRVQVFNVHLDDSPYQPYQLLKIGYGPHPVLKTAREAIRAAEATRGAGLKLLFADMAVAGKADAVFVFGDFNEPSHRDWIAATVRAGLQPLPVAFPSVRALEKRGFVDLFRRAHPDPVAKPGFTWTPTTDPQSPDDHHDRIDFTLAKAQSLRVIAAGIVGEKSPQADIVVTPWPSDHRASYARVRF